MAGSLRQQLRNRLRRSTDRDTLSPPGPGPAPIAARASATGRTPLYFHIGAPKTGTTFLQRIMWQNQEALAAEGFLYPGDFFGSHVQAAFDLRGAGFEGYADPQVAGKWRGFVDAAREWSGPAIFSQELFSPAEPEHIDTAMADLNFADVHIIFTARELSRQIPAAWQEDVKNRFSVRFDEFVTQIREPSSEPHRLGRMFWRMQDAVEVLARWTTSLPPDRIHVVTVPARPGSPDELWRRFASVVGIAADSIDSSRAFQNSSLGAAETTFLRKLNEALAAEVGWPLYNEMVKHYLAQAVLVNRDDTIPIVLPAADRAWAAERAGVMVDGLRAAGYDVIGSLDDLLPNPPTDAPQRDADDPPVDAQLDVAVEAIAAVLLRVSRIRRGVDPG